MEISIDKGGIVAIIESINNGKSIILRCVNLLEESTSEYVIFEGQKS